MAKKKAPAATITVQCVYNKKHKKTIDVIVRTMEMPFCEIDGGPMIAIQAKVRR